MNIGLDNTLSVLAKTDNEAALRVLVPALDSPHSSIQLGALRALLQRRSPAGHQEILRRLHFMPSSWKSVISEHRGRMLRTLRDAVLSSDAQRCSNACQAAVWFREYDVVPTLLNALGQRTQQQRELLAATVLELVKALHTELLQANSEPNRGRDPQIVRSHTVTALEASVEKFLIHERIEVIESFLLLTSRENPILGRLLTSQHHVAYSPVVSVLSEGQHPAIIRLLLSFLEDPHVPPSVLKVIAGRADLKFVQSLLRKIGRAPSRAVAQNLKRIESIRWLRGSPAFYDQLDDAAQHGVVRLVMASGIPRLQAFSTVEFILMRGKPGGRREAAEALKQFNGVEANALALRALHDRDPQVQATIVGQLRRRSIPGVLSELVELIDSPHALVRKAVRESLSEFHFNRYLGAFDILDEEVRQSTGALVMKIDPQATHLLRREMRCGARGRQQRALAMAQAMDAVEQIEEDVIDLLKDGDYLVRAEAASALGRSTTLRSELALSHVAKDSHPTVRQAAQRSLHEREEFSSWRAEFNDPRD